MTKKMNTYLDDRIKLNFEFNVHLLQEDLTKLKSTDWIEHFVKQNYDGEWNVIPLRGPATATHPVMMIYSDPTCEEFSDTPYLENSIYFRHVLDTFKCPLHAVRIMKLTAGSKIKEHTDHDLGAEYGTVRLHIPILTSDEINFMLNGTRVVMNEGECWYLRLSDPHYVENKSLSDRVHLVIDAQMNPWLNSLLHRE